MTPPVIQIADIKIEVRNTQGDGRKEHPPAHAHVVWQNNDYSFPISIVKKLTDNDFKRSKGILSKKMKKAAQIALENYQVKLLTAWNDQVFHSIETIKDMKRFQQNIKKKSR